MDLDTINIGRTLFRNNGTPGKRISPHFGGAFRSGSGKGSSRDNKEKSAPQSAFRNKAGKSCFKCGKKGHLLYECCSKGRQQFHVVEVQPDSDEFCNLAESCHSLSIQSQDSRKSRNTEAICSDAQSTEENQRVAQVRQEDIARSVNLQMQCPLGQDGGVFSKELAMPLN